jgi:hypothetical protein
VLVRRYIKATKAAANLASRIIMAGQSNVIDWSEALQQCGDDEEFLREVLVDLRTETETQLTNIAGIIQVCIIIY